MKKTAYIDDMSRPEALSNSYWTVKYEKMLIRYGMSRPFNVTTGWGITLSNDQILEIHTVGVPKVQDWEALKKR